jgi:hypothetical protein
MSVIDDWDDPRLHVVDSSGYPFRWYSQSFRYSQSPRENGLLLRFLAGSPLTRKGMGGGLHRENHSANHGNEEEVYSQGSIFNDMSSELIRARKPKRWDYGKEWRDGDVMLIHLMSAVKANTKILRSICK